MVLENKSFINKLFIIIWIFLLLTLNSNITYTINLDNFDWKFNLNNFIILINTFRFFIPFLILPIGIAFLIRKKIKFNGIMLIYLFYGVSQLIALLFNTIIEENSRDFLTLIDHLQISIAFISLIIISEVISKTNVQLYKSLLIISLMIIFVVCFYFFSKIIINFNFLESSYIYTSSTLAPETKFILQAKPRITGLARMTLLILIFLFFLFISKNFNKKLSILIFSGIFICNLIIWGTQSRGAIVGLLILIITYLLFINDKFLKKIYISLLIFLLPIISYESALLVREKILIKNFNQLNQLNQSFKQSTRLTQNNKDINIATSGRINIWLRAVELIKKKNIIVGLGPQADRLILGKEVGLKDSQILDNNSSNVIIYSYLSAGIVGLILILLIYFKIITKILKQNINLKKLNKKYFYFNTAIAGTLFLLTRGLFENGISLFNLDSCFFVIFYFLIKKRYFNHSTSLS